MDVMKQIKNDPYIPKKFPWIKDLESFTPEEQKNLLESVLIFMTSKNYNYNIIADLDLFIANNF